MGNVNFSPNCKELLNVDPFDPTIDNETAELVLTEAENNPIYSLQMTREAIYRSDAPLLTKFSRLDALEEIEVEQIKEYLKTQTIH